MIRHRVIVHQTDYHNPISGEVFISSKMKEGAQTGEKGEKFSKMLSYADPGLIVGTLRHKVLLRAVNVFG